MRLNFETFVAAVRAHLSPAIAAALPAANAAMFGENIAEIQDTTAGALILRALLGKEAAPIELASLHAPLLLPLDLPAADALSHPAFGPWLAETLTEAVTKPIVAGARVMNFAPGVPAYGPIELVQGEGITFSGTAALDFQHGDQTLRAVASYGSTAGEHRVLQNAYLSGSALFDVGIAARARPEGPAPKKNEPPSGLGFDPGHLVAGNGAMH